MEPTTFLCLISRKSCHTRYAQHCKLLLLVPCSIISMCHKASSMSSRGASAAAEIRASDIGTRAGLFEVQKIGDEFFTFVVDCDKPKACSIVLRGASKVCATCTLQQRATQLYAHHASVCLLHHSSHLVSQCHIVKLISCREDCPSQNSRLWFSSP